MSTPRDPASDVAELRELLHAPHRSELEALQERIDLLEQRLSDEALRTEEISKALVDALKMQEQEATGPFVQTIRPNVEAAVHTSSRIDSAVMAEALYPVLGPAMRKMIANLFTAEGVKSGGRSFSVDQALLIHRESGLLLASFDPDGSEPGEDDLISGMLDAIRAFVDDAFEADEHDGLRDLRVGEVSVLIEWGPHAVLAAVTRGLPTPEFRNQMQVTLESIHESYRDELVEFGGDDQALAGSTTELEALFRKPKRDVQGVRRWAVPLAVIVIVVVIVLLVVAL